MRLKQKEIQNIKDVVREYDPDAQIYLFGSRADDTKKGGDIDLLIFSGILSEHDKRRIRLNLYDRLGEQKIDIIIARDLTGPFIRMAYEEGVAL